MEDLKKDETLEETQVEENVETKEVDEIKKLNDMIEELTKANEELKLEMLRDRAELENFKRRTNEERMKERKYAQKDILTKLIGVIDNFERSLNAKNQSLEDFQKGVEMIKAQLDNVLEQEGLKVIETKEKEFDPNYHQAVVTDSIDEIENNIIIEEFQKGYIYKDRVLRPSMVKVNMK